MHKYSNLLHYLILFGLILLIACNNTKDDSIIEASGTIEATEIQISPLVHGRIIELLVDEGNKVKIDEILCRLDDEELKLQLKQAQAMLDAAKAQVRLLNKGARQEQIKRMKAQVTQAEAQLKSASEDLKRIEELFDSNTITKKQLEDAETRHTIAEAQYEQAQNMLREIELGARDEEILIAIAKREQAQASLELVQKKINDCIIISHIDGIITNKMIELGELANIGMPLFTISDLEHLWLRIYINETQLGDVYTGQTVEISVDAFPLRTFPGYITHISENAEFTPKNIQTKEERVKLVFGIKISLENPLGLLKQGMPADAIIMKNRK